MHYENNWQSLNSRPALCFPPIDPSAVQTKYLYGSRLDRLAQRRQEENA